MPQLGDPSFHRSVVLMIEHAETGAMGLVLTRGSSLTLEQLANGQELDIAARREKDSVYLGGPVEPQRGFVLHDRPDVEESVELIPGLYLSVTVDALAPLLASPHGRLRFCMGYSGWGPHQVEEEIAQGAWLFTEAQPASVLDTDPAHLWDHTLRTMGVDPAMLQVGRGVN